jgi:hypothetical protein
MRHWEQAAAVTGITLGEPTVASATWRDAVDARLDEDFFAGELERSRAGELTEDCRDGACAACGVCGGEIGMELLV